MIHGVCEERERGPEGTPHEVVAGEDGGDVFRVGVAEVAEDSEEEEEGAHAEEGAADDGHDPVDRGAGGPAEPEEADGDEEGADEGGLQAEFGAEEALVVELRFEVAVEVVEEGDDDDEASDGDAEEGEALTLEREAVHVDEYDGEALEPEIEQSVDQGDVDVQQEADRLGEGEGEWPDENHQPNLSSCHALGLNLRLALHPWIVRERPDPPCPPVEDVAAACFRQKEEQEHKAEP